MSTLVAHLHQDHGKHRGVFARLARAIGPGRWLRRPLELGIGRNRYVFATPMDFEFALAGTCAVPVGRFAEMIALRPDELRHESRGIRKVEKQFVAVLEKCIEDPESIGALIRELGVKQFSKDHRWRDIISSLNALGPGQDEYKKIALVKYLQYLASRHDLVNMIYSAKTAEPVDEDISLSPEPPAGPAEHATVAFDVGDLQDAPRVMNPYERLPRGQTVALRLPDGATVDILLSKHKFKLVAGDPLALVDSTGHRYDLHPGKNRIGRHVDNDVTIDTAYRSVSRKHLILEPRAHDVVRITDLSAHGTFVPPEYLLAASH
jgi:hypothetical protein